MRQQNPTQEFQNKIQDLQLSCTYWQRKAFTFDPNSKQPLPAITNPTQDQYPKLINITRIFMFERIALQQVQIQNIQIPEFSLIDPKQLLEAPCPLPKIPQNHHTSTSAQAKRPLDECPFYKNILKKLQPDSFIRGTDHIRKHQFRRY